MSKTHGLFPTARWSNQNLKLYHGTLDRHARSIIKRVTLTHAKSRSDFGAGFYTTTVERQARAWAWQLATRQHDHSSPAVVCFQVDRNNLAALHSLFFVRAAVDADDYWSLIKFCRQGNPDHARQTKKCYDGVVGPVAISWRKRLSLHDSDQVSFHTQRAIDWLNQSKPRIIP